MTPPDCDLRDYPWMPLDVRRMLTSETWVLGSAEEKCAAVTLWCEAWQQVPAASLPDNDRMLAHLSMAGAGWKKIRDEVLKSWVKCSDGRLYHPTVAEKANESWERKLAQRQRTEAARQAKADRLASKTTGNSGSPVTETVTTSVTEPVTAHATESVTEIVTGSTRQDKTRQDSREERTPSLREAPQAARKVGSRLPTDWCPSETEVAFAEGLGLIADQVAAKFRDFWHAKPGQGGVKLDWTATWRNWCREDADRRRPQAAEGPLEAMVRAERMARTAEPASNLLRIFN
jgi:hypothetical protein